MDQQIGNLVGVTADGNMPTLLSDITADGANTVTISDLSKITVGMVIDIVNKTSAAVLASARTVTDLTSAGVLTYNGADVTAVAGTHGVYATGKFAATGASNLNGGRTPQEGFHDFGNMLTVQSMKDRLTAFNSTTFTAARLNTMTYNDLVYAVRLADASSTVH